MHRRSFHTWRVGKAFAGKSLLFFLEKKLEDIPSKKALKRALEKNTCFVNSKRERFSCRKLEHKDEVQLDTNWQQALNLSVKKALTIYEDEYLTVLDKPSGLECTSENFEKDKLFLCHRLDKETSGLLLLAKTAEVRDLLLLQFKERLLEKTYLAIVDGSVQRESGSIKSFLTKKGFYEGQTIYGSGVHGKEAITFWKLLEKNEAFSLLLVQPKTGKTHQIRVHLAEMGHPILGDFQYCRQFSYPLYIQRVLLHSYKLSFRHPKTEEKLFLEAPIPEDFYTCFERNGLCLAVS